MSILTPAPSPGPVADGSPAADPGGPRRSPRPLGARPAVVQPRAIVGALLVVLAVVGTYAAITGSRQAPSTSFVVARGTIALGTVITADDLVVRTGDLPADVRDQTFASIDEVAGAVALGPLDEGSVITRSVVRASDDQAPVREVSLAVERSQLGGRIARGDFVDLIGVRDEGDAPVPAVLARNLRVLQVSEGDDGVGGGGDAVLTVAVADEQQACAVSRAMHEDKLTVVRVTGVAPVAAAPTSGPCAGTSGQAGTSPGALTTPTTSPEVWAFLTTTTTTSPPPPTTRAEEPTTRRAEPSTTRSTTRETQR